MMDNPIEEQKRELIKKNQELYSWNWFYTNSNENLMINRYPKANKTKVDSQGNKRDIVIMPYIDYSERWKQDREQAYKCQTLINENQLKLNKLFN